MADEQATPQPQMNPDLMGYPSVEALVAAKRAGDAEAKRLFDENQRKDQLLMQAYNNGMGNPRQSVPDRTASPEDRLTEFGVPVDALGAYIDRRLGQALQPLSDGVAARQTVVGRNPDYVKYEHDVAAFISTDTDLSSRYPKLFAADPVAAMEYALLKFGESRRGSVTQPHGVAQGQTDAGIPTSRAGDSRAVGGQGDSRIQEAFDRFQKTGSSRDARSYAETRLGPLLEQQFQRAGQTLGPDR